MFYERLMGSQSQMSTGTSEVKEIDEMSCSK